MSAAAVVADVRVSCVGGDDNEDGCAVDVWQGAERRANEGLCGQLVVRGQKVSVRFCRRAWFRKLPSQFGFLLYDALASEFHQSYSFTLGIVYVTRSTSIMISLF